MLTTNRWVWRREKGEEGRREKKRERRWRREGR